MLDYGLYAAATTAATCARGTTAATLSRQPNHAVNNSCRYPLQCCYHSALALPKKLYKKQYRMWYLCTTHYTAALDIGVVHTTAATDISIRVVHEQKCSIQNTNRTESSYNYRHAAVESNAHYSSTQNNSRLESF
eukprot:18004-Heterococcus_DN1.PRE.4